ncbi:MAG: hypothetical protein Ct9H300mP27_08220 [Chloroflexota bacterium]|nr:MAG: hypothetical protein Ct9H300mP27_08220 [Chloroflexota bacterium]
MKVDYSKETLKEFISLKQRTDNPLFTDKAAVAHPSWTAGWAEMLLPHNFAIPTSCTLKQDSAPPEIPVGTSV